MIFTYEIDALHDDVLHFSLIITPHCIMAHFRIAEVSVLVRVMHASQTKNAQPTAIAVGWFHAWTASVVSMV